MANPLSSMLDELMGRNRNALPSEKAKDIRWDDEEVCSYFNAGYCPHELFTNTKADLGICEKIHDEKLRDQYRKSSRFEKAGVEDDFLNYLQKIDGDMRKKINRNKQRLELTQPDGKLADVNHERVEEKVNQLSEKITALLSQAEQLGAEGKVDEAQSVIAMMEELKEERERCRKTLDTPAAELKLMEVCDTCGCFLILGDSQHRLDEHLTGKQHTGFAKIKATIEELIRRKEEKRKQRDDEMRKLREEKDKQREKDRSKRSSRDNDKSSSSSSRNKSHDKDHHSSRRDNHKSSSHRSRSRSKDGKLKSTQSSSSKSHDKSRSSDKHTSSSSSRHHGDSSSKHRHHKDRDSKSSKDKKDQEHEQQKHPESNVSSEVDNENHSEQQLEPEQQVNDLVASDSEVTYTKTADNIGLDCTAMEEQEGGHDTNGSYTTGDVAARGETDFDV